MADSSYAAEKQNIEQLLTLQKPMTSPVRKAAPIDVSSTNLDPADFMAPRFTKKKTSKVGVATNRVALKWVSLIRGASYKTV